MLFHGKSGMLILAQVDHCSGEQLGFVYECLMAAGASNVQFIPTVTKKNRPAHIVLVDLAPSRQAEVEAVVARQLGVGGWQVLHTEHRYQRLEVTSLDVVVSYRGQTVSFAAQAKVIGDRELGTRPEFDSSAALCRLAQDRFGVALGIAEAEELLREAFIQGRTVVELPEEEMG